MLAWPRLVSLPLTKTKMSASSLRRLLNWWPPHCLGPGIRVDEIRDDFRYARVSLPLRFYNQNYVGTHFGGSLYAMTDSMYMLLLLHILGPGYIVWDKAATIEYKKTGTGTVTAEFVVPDELIESLLTLAPDEKRFVDLDVDVKNELGEVVASVVKTEYIRRKPLKPKL
jgi:acyl-coenzyme A thioesterase PaaI-like protein